MLRDAVAAVVAPGSEVVGSIMLTASHMPMHNNGERGGGGAEGKGGLFLLD